MGAYSNKWLSEETGRAPDGGLRGKLDPHHVCNYCHWRNEYPVLRRKSKPGFSAAKSSGVAASLRAEERACVIAAVQTHTKLLSSESMIEVPVVEQDQTAFVSDGFVSLV